VGYGAVYALARRRGRLRVFYPSFEALNLALLLFEEQVFDSAQARLYQLEFPIYCCAKLLDVLFAGHGALTHLSQALKGGEGKLSFAIE
jgi:hypothetical protein